MLMHYYQFDGKEPCNGIGSQVPAEHINGILTGNLLILKVTRYPTVLLSRIYNTKLQTKLKHFFKICLRMFWIYLSLSAK